MIKKTIKSVFPKKFLAQLIDIKSSPAYIGRTIIPDTAFGSAFFYNLSRFLNYTEYSKRRSQAKEYIANDNNEIFIAENKGYLVHDFSENELFQSCINKCQSIAKERNYPAKTNQFKKSFLCADKLNIYDLENKSIIAFATSEDILSIISKYLGTIPVLQNMHIFYSDNKEFYKGRSQEYHLDGLDTKQVKCFIPLEDITEDCGPLTVIPAYESMKLYSKLKKKHGPLRNQKFSDETIYNHISKQKAIPLTGKVGSIIFADTSRCYHYGSRPASKSRLVLMLHYTTAFSKNMPICNRKPLASLPYETAHPNLTKLVTGLSYKNYLERFPDCSIKENY